KLFSGLGNNPVLAYIVGAGVAFVLQSSSASIGILQAFSTSGQLTFQAIYPVLVGIYLGDCVTTAIVCNIGAKPEAKRVGVVNILFNLSESVVIFLGVLIIRQTGLLDGIWNSTIHSGGIANTNTVFNLTCALALFPMLGLYEKLSYRIVKEKAGSKEAGKYDEVLEGLNPVFYSTPAIAFGRCYDMMMAMYDVARLNIHRAFELIGDYDESMMQQIWEDENYVDMMADRGTNYLIEISPHVTTDNHVQILNYYYAVLSEFERLGDHATNIAQIAKAMHENQIVFSDKATAELNVLRELTARILDYSHDAFQGRDLTAARHIEPHEEVVDDLVNALKQNHMDRLREGSCGAFAGTEFLNLLTEVERISDICSNIGVATVARVKPELKHQVHDYVSMLHSGSDADFNKEYQAAHNRYFRLLQK
ncbi:MAG: Na/Pi cotransporter family protein, partial [Blautia sp.]|nr:Na/Pi cotransporter family protein [Blautia sp.]